MGRLAKALQQEPTARSRGKTPRCEDRCRYDKVQDRRHRRKYPKITTAADAGARQADYYLEAERRYRAALERDPALPAPHGGLGILYARTGARDDAIVELTQYLAADIGIVERTRAQAVLDALKKKALENSTPSDEKAATP